MNRDQKAAAIDEIAEQIRESEAVFAVDYRGISVPQAADAAHEAARRRRHLPGRQEHAHRACRRRGRGRGAEGAPRGPDRADLRPRRRRRGREGDRRRAADVGRCWPSRAASSTATPSTRRRSRRSPRLPVARRALRAARRHRGLADHRPGPQPERPRLRPGHRPRRRAGEEGVGRDPGGRARARRSRPPAAEAAPAPRHARRRTTTRRPTRTRRPRAATTTEDPAEGPDTTETPQED